MVKGYIVPSLEWEAIRGGSHGHERECDLEIVAGQITAMKHQERKKNLHGKRTGSYYP